MTKKEKAELDKSKEIIIPVDGSSMVPAVQTQNTAIAKPAMSTKEAMNAIKAYQELKAAIKQPEDIQIIRVNGEDKEFLKKSYWRKVATFFNLTDEIISEKKETYTYYYEDGKSYPMFEWMVTVRATHSNGRYAEGTASCSLEEQWTPNPKQDVNNPPPKVRHNIKAIAATRAKNRAISDLVGGGEVSAEEMTGDENSYNKPKVEEVDMTKPYVKCPGCTKPMTFGKTGKGVEKYDCNHGCMQPPPNNNYKLTTWADKAVFTDPAKSDDKTPPSNESPSNEPDDSVDPNVLCPSCNAPMRLIDGENGQFYGCSTYQDTKCSGSRKYVPPKVEKLHKEINQMKALFLESELYDEQEWTKWINEVKGEYKKDNDEYFNNYNEKHCEHILELINAKYDREINPDTPAEPEEAPAEPAKEKMTADAKRLMKKCNEALKDMKMDTFDNVEDLRGCAEEIYKIKTKNQTYTAWIGALSIRLTAELKKYKKKEAEDESLPF